ncbi:polymer-forming cytoskeletal protein [Shewanella polaris]|uniref:Polymer-forming cytoskeletal protein n=1 Tax=Shewanella polaris TaxID=2588449 RepID=A0A4Y5YJ47_9GAMM|nr:polymer-forming cytoskeletal protein [Shewanella polaris]QDE32493.1 polymer-forming cytoskeletal protein [Shewanella polaris]
MKKKGGMTYIGVDMSLNGDMEIQGPAVIAGQTKGKISSTDQVNIELSGNVEGEVFCQEMLVSGVFKGKLHCKKLIITSSGIVDGEVSSHLMEIYGGGQFIGMRTKGPESSGLPQINNERFLSQDDVTSTSHTKLPILTRKLSYLAVAIIVVITGVVVQPTISSALNRAQETSAEINQTSAAQYPLSALTVTEKNAAALLQEMDQQASFAEQAEELLNAGQSDVNVAMEDLDALAQTSEVLGDNQNISDDVE